MGPYPRAIVVASGHIFRADPLSKRTDGARRPKQPTHICRGRVWSEPSEGKSSSEKTMQLARPTVSICIRPSCDVVVSTRIQLKDLIKVSIWVVEKANKLQIEIRACVLCSCLMISSSSLAISSLVVSGSMGQDGTGGYCLTTLPPLITYWISGVSTIPWCGVKIKGV